MTFKAAPEDTDDELPAGADPEGSDENASEMNIDLEELDEDDEPPAAPAKARDDDRPPRAERRANRLRKEREGREAAEREAEARRQESEQHLRALQQTNERLAFLEGRQAQQGGGPTNPYDAAVAEAEEAQAKLYKDYNAIRPALKPNEHDDWQKRATEAQARVFDARAERIQARREYQSRQHQPDPLQLSMQAEFPEVYQNPKAAQWVLHEGNKRHVEMGRDARDINIVRQTFRDAVARFNLRDTPQDRRVDPKERQRFAGTPRGGAGSSASQKREVKVGKMQIVAATEMYPKLPPREAVKKWLRATGWKND